MYSYFFFSCVTIKCLSFCFILDSLRHVSDLYFALLVSPPHYVYKSSAGST